MKVVIINGSPRKGNTKALVDAFMEGSDGYKGKEKAEIECYNLKKDKVAPCQSCCSCQKTGKCKHSDSTNDILRSIKKADAIVFATPIYWWGMTAQMKAAVDKLYVLGADNYKIPYKKVGLIIVGGSPTGTSGYTNISSQFKDICEFLKWDIEFVEEVQAYDKDDAKKNKAAIKECMKLYKKLL